MGHDIQMVDKEGKELLVEQFKEGGTYPLIGSKSAWVSVTYNYAWFFYKFLDNENGIKVIYGKTGREAQPILEKAIEELTSKGMGNGDSKQEENYWIPTPTNVTKILRLLKSWCEQHPEGIFQGD